LGSSSPSRLLQLRSPPRCRKCALRAAAKARGLVAFSGSILLRAAANALSALQQMHVVSSRLVRLGCWSPPVSSVFSARFVLQCSLCLHVRSLARAWFGLAVDLCVAARPLTSAIKSFVLRSSLFTLRGARYCASRHRQRRSFRPGQRCLLSQLPLCGAFVRSSVLPGTAPRGTDSVGSSDLASVFVVAVKLCGAFVRSTSPAALADHPRCSLSRLPRIPICFTVFFCGSSIIHHPRLGS
jgi:hypothetical protein